MGIEWKITRKSLPRESSTSSIFSAPQLVLIGGGISAQGEKLLAPLREIVKEYAFGGSRGEVPEIEAASLGNQAGMIGAASIL